MTPQQLDDQCQVHIDRWVDLYSEECRNMDPDHKLAVKWFKMCQGPDGMFTDKNGRIWGKGNDGYFYPYHFEHCGKLIGYRASKLASN